MSSSIMDIHKMTPIPSKFSCAYAANISFQRLLRAACIAAPQSDVDVVLSMRVNFETQRSSKKAAKQSLLAKVMTHIEKDIKPSR